MQKERENGDINETTDTEKIQQNEKNPAEAVINGGVEDGVGTDDAINENAGGADNNTQQTEDNLKQLKSENTKLAQALDEFSERYKRMIAEYDNYRKRVTKEREQLFADAYADALKEILPVIDNLELALAYSDNGCSSADKLAEGISMTLEQFREALGRLGAEEIPAKGEKFNPELHDAVMHDQDENFGENEIAEVFKKGYRRGDKIIRHAMVKVVN